MKISEAFDPSVSLPSGNFQLEWDHQHEELRRIREAEASEEWWSEQQKKLGKMETPPVKPYCFACYAPIEWKARTKPDWRFGPLQQFNAGTDKPHDCIEVRRNLWKRYGK